MKKLLLMFVIALMSLPMVVMGQCGTENLTATADDVTYQSLKVGPHCWMQTNLRTNVPGSFVYRSDMYPDEAANEETFGRLYPWAVAAGNPVVVGEHGFVQGVCPEGWHLPLPVEVQKLASFGATDIHSTEEWLVPGTDATGFGLLPGGFYNDATHRFENLGGEAYLWSVSTANEPVEVWSNCYCELLVLNSGKVNNGLSVRCVYKIYEAQVNTQMATNIKAYQADLNGDVVFAGYDVNFTRGFLYGTDANALSNDTVQTGQSEEGTYSFTVKDLQPNTTYYYRAYVINEFDTTFGQMMSFTTPVMTVTTDSANTITMHTAKIYGNVTSMGGYEPLNAGFLYGTSRDALTSTFNYTDDITATGSYNGTLSELTENTTYYFCAFLTNGEQTVYGDTLDFTTPYLAVTTDSASAITTNAASIYGNLTNLSGYTSANVGFLYGTDESLGNVTTETSQTSAGSYNVALNDLTPNTKYYYCAYAINGVDTVYGDTLNFTTLETFTCGTSTVKDVDDIKYNTVKIGDQCWMKENLRTKTSTGNTYYPNEDENNVASYGLLYDWTAVMQGSSSSEANPSGVQGICPTGWHVPSNAEWTQLFDYVSSQSAYCCGGNTGSIAKALASTTSWNYSINDCAVGRNRSSNNATGFSALPAGIYAGSYYGGYGGFCTSAFFWSTTEYYDFGTVRYFESNDAGVRQNADNKSNGYSVRCLRDAADGSELGENESNGTPEEPAADMSVTTDNANTMTSTSATLYGNVTDLGGNVSVNAGFKYGTSETAMNTKVDDAVSATGLYSINITDLTANTTYYYAAYVATATDTAYGDILNFTTEPVVATFTCGTSTVMDVDGIKYNTVQIGDQCWMKENLRTKTSTGNTYYPNEDENNVASYGLLYDWAAVMQGSSSSEANPSGVQGICPTGWHVPSNAEWTQLFDYVSSQSAYCCGGNTGSIAKALASTTSWNYSINDCAVGRNRSSNNATGFSALPAGIYAGSYYGGYGGFCTSAFFWSTTEYYDFGTVRYFESNDAGVRQNADNKSNGYSVRCVKDAEPAATFTCGTSTVKDHEDNVYTTVKIGNQCWTKQNMRAKTSPNGTLILETPPADEVSYTGKKAYYPQDNVENAATYGLLYNWNAAVDTFNKEFSETDTNASRNLAVNVVFSGNRRGICPQGWHVPSSAEWALMMDTVKNNAANSCGGSNANVANALASGSWTGAVECGAGNETAANANQTGFSALPAGYCFEVTTLFGSYAGFWTATQRSGTYTYQASRYRLSSTETTVDGANNNKSNAFSVRCLRDAADGSELGENESNDTPEEPAATFTCGTSTVKDVDNNEYNTVKIGDQCWTKENLRTSTTTGNTYHANNNASNDETYGLLYDWAAVMQGATSSTTNPSGVQGICPTGWHVPSNAEWTQLTNYVSSQSEYVCDPIPTIVWALASPTGWNSTTVPCSPGNNPSVNNATGFSVVPAGLYNESCVDFGYSAFLWAASQTDIGMAYSLYMGYSNLAVSTFSADMNRGYSVRCLRDAADGSELGENESNDIPEEPAAEMSVTTDSANMVTSTTVTLYGNVTDLGGNASVNAGFKYGTSETAMSTMADDAVSATGLYSINITGLTANTTYYYTAYTATTTDTVYGDTLRFRTLSINPCLGVPTIKDVDNNTYNTVQIGDQCWMAENLRTTTINGYGNEYTNPAADVETYGRYYDWAAVMQGATSSDANPSGVQGICPTGWHVPSNAEWTQLTNYVSSQSEYVCGGNSEYIAKALASTTGWKSSTGAGWDSNTGACVIGNTPEANNTTGFSAVPAGHYSNGYGYYNVGYNEFGDDAYFWSATQKTVDFVYYRDLYYNNPAVFDYYLFREFGFSVRCVKDAEPETFTCGTSTVKDVDNNEYNTVQIGDQCWMAQNLRTSTTTGNTYHANNNADNDEAYGLLYDWTAVMQGATSSGANPSGVQGICPTGWHVPSDAEWMQMEMELGMSQSDANKHGDRGNFAVKLSGSTGWTSSTVTNAVGNPSATDRNSTGFSALPAGSYTLYGYGNFGDMVLFWSATAYNDIYAYLRYLGYANVGVYRNPTDKGYGYSVRCLKN